MKYSLIKTIQDRIRSLTSSRSVKRRRRSKNISTEQLETRHMLSAVVELVADLDTSPRDGAIGFYSHEQVEVNGITFFMAETFADGKQLWRTDGTSEGTFRLTDRMPGPGESIIGHLTPAGNFLYFASNNNHNGADLWRSDGTVAGTQIVKHFESYQEGSYITGIISFGGGALVSTASQDGVKLVLSDGTASGTESIFTLRGRETIWRLSAESNGRVFFSTQNNETWNKAATLWALDSASPVPQVLTTHFFSHIDSLVVSNGRATFVVYSFQAGDSVWTSDGSISGTHPVGIADDRPGNVLSSLHQVDDRVFFTAARRVETSIVHDLWVIPGSSESMIRLTIGSDGQSFPEDAAEFQGNWFFLRNERLWKSDGTVTGTTQLRTASNVRFRGITQINDILLLAGWDPAHGLELWLSNGTSEGTHLMRDIIPGPVSSLADGALNGLDYHQHQGHIVFAADDGIHGREIWVSDGTVSGTNFLKELATGTANSYPNSFVHADGELFFVTNESDSAVGGDALWKTTAHSSAVARLGAGTDLISRDGDIYFKSGLPGEGYFTPGMFRWTGTSKEPVPGVSLDFVPQSPVIEVGSRQLVIGTEKYSEGASHFALRTIGINGEPSVTIKGFASANTTHYVVHDGLLYFFARDFLHWDVQGSPWHLWRSDGTPTGTFMLADNGAYSFQNLQVGMFDDKLCIAGAGAPVFTDGTVKGTHTIFDVVTNGRLDQILGVFQDSLLYYSYANDIGRFIGRTDGTIQNTSRVRGPISIAYHQSVSTQAGIFFFALADERLPNLALWTTDGTSAGTRIIYQFDEAISDTRVTNFSAVGEKLIFTMLNIETRQSRIWISDGTNDGTVQLRHNLEHRLTLNEFAQFTLYDGGIAFAASTEEVGFELFRIDTTINITAPTGLTVNDHADGVDVIWPDVPGAIQYDVWMQNLSDPSAPVIRKRVNDSQLTLPNDTGYVIADDLSSNAYRVWVRSLPVLGEPSVWSTPKDFVLGQNPVMHTMPAVSSNAAPTFRWTGPQDVVSYELWLSNRDTKTRPIYRTGLQSTSFAVTDPLPPAKYAVWVRGTRADGTTTDWSALTEFEILALPVQLTSGKGDSRIPRPTFAWAAVTDATGYDVRIFAAGTSAIIYSANNVSDLTHTPLQDLPAGKFTVYVRALRGTRPLSAWGNGDALWLKLPPLNLRSTATGVAWDAVPFAVSYTFELRDSRGALAVPRQSQTGTTFDPATPLTPGQYSLRVFTNFSNLSSNWSATYAFELFRPPVAITSSGAATVDATPTITWTAAPGAATYEVLVTKSGSAVPVYARTGVTTTFHRIDIPLRNGIYEIQVRAIFADGSRSPWSPVQQLDIGPAATLTYAAGKLSWSSVNAATNYELWINYLGVPSQSRIVYQPLYVGTSYTLPSTLPKGRYQTWLRAIRAENGELYAGAWTSVDFDLG